MEERLHARLEELRAEYHKGRGTLEELEGQVASVRATMLRIAGAIQVLDELTAPAAATAPASADEAPLEVQRNGRVAVVP